MITIFEDNSIINQDIIDGIDNIIGNEEVLLLEYSHYKG
jgi:hypothetical protein